MHQNRADGSADKTLTRIRQRRADLCGSLRRCRRTDAPAKEILLVQCKLTSANVKKSLRSSTVGKYIAIPSNFYRTDVMELIAPPMVTPFGFILWSAAFVASLSIPLPDVKDVGRRYSSLDFEGRAQPASRSDLTRTTNWIGTMMSAWQGRRDHPPRTRESSKTARCAQLASRGGGGGRRPSGAFHVCDNFTSWGSAPGADGPTFRYMPRDSTRHNSRLALNTFVTEFNTKWNNDGGCSSACEGCPKMEHNDESDGFYGYNSYGSHRLKFANTQFHVILCSLQPRVSLQNGVFMKLGDIYDYLIETDELCSWTLKTCRTAARRQRRHPQSRPPPWRLRTPNSSALALAS